MTSILWISILLGRLWSENIITNLLGTHLGSFSWILGSLFLLLNLLISNTLYSASVVFSSSEMIPLIKPLLTSLKLGTKTFPPSQIMIRQHWFASREFLNPTLTLDLVCCKCTLCWCIFCILNFLLTLLVWLELLLVLKQYWIHTVYGLLLSSWYSLIMGFVEYIGGLNDFLLERNLTGVSCYHCLYLMIIDLFSFCFYELKTNPFPFHLSVYLEYSL